MGTLATSTRVTLAAAFATLGLLQAQPKALPRQALPEQPKAKLGDNSAGSRGQPAHNIPLRDPEGDTIQPGDRRAMPFSVTQTCGGECHDVATISRGWHFNGFAGGNSGRKGQPWLLVDRDTATQIPLSYRPWAGTWRPQQVGVSNFEFATRFGGRMPGGIPPDSGHADRSGMTGNLEVNCLSCHDASPAYDQAEYARQVAMQNFRYAPTAASGLGQVTGSTREMPDLFDYLMPQRVEDSLQAKVPKVEYSPSRFLPSGKMAFDIVREVKSTRCYYCHTNVDVEQTGASHWKSKEDVHLARGIGCVQCHRNGLDHNITRGDEKEMSLSCKGCHLESNDMGAPHPNHEGIPPIHLEKLTCTACHSGPMPTKETRQMKNGMTHGLGEFNVNKSSQALPHIVYPVFARGEDGKIGPNRLVWPAFWGRMSGATVQPLHPDKVKAEFSKAKIVLAPNAEGTWPAADDRSVEQALSALGDRAVYVSGGKLHKLDSAGRLKSEEYAAAAPYLWPIAHDVRPASQALGAKGCQDCHSEDAAFLFGNVAVDSPLASDRATSWKMNRFETKIDAAYQARLAGSWKYRPVMKIIGLSAAGLLFLFLLAYVLRGMDRLSALTIGRLR